MVEPARDVGGLSSPASIGAFLLLCLWQGSRVGLMCLAYRSVVVEVAWIRPIAFAGLLALSESVFPMVFPWGSYGFVHAAPIWAQLASLGGAGLVTASIGLVNEAVAVAIDAPRGKRARTAWGALAGVGLLTAYGAWRMHLVDADVFSAIRSKVLVVQGNLRPARLEQRDPAAVYRERTLRSLAAHPEIDWIVWPETAIFYTTEAPKLAEFFRDVLLRDRRHGITAPRIDRPLVTGLVIEEGTARFNSVVAADASGSLTGRYDKRLLVPLGETRALGEGEPQFAAKLGENPEPLMVGAHPIGAFVCFEALDSNRVQAAMAEGRAELLLNPTSDAWFAGSIGPRMHLAFAKVRAIEHARYLLRPTTTGVTALIDPVGRQAWALPEGRDIAGITEIAWMKPITSFTRHGAAATTLFAAVLSLICAAIGVARRKRRSSAPVDS